MTEIIKNISNGCWNLRENFSNKFVDNGMLVRLLVGCYFSVGLLSDFSLVAGLLSLSLVFFSVLVSPSDLLELSLDGANLPPDGDLWSVA